MASPNEPVLLSPWFLRETSLAMVHALISGETSTPSQVDLSPSDAAAIKLASKDVHEAFNPAPTASLRSLSKVDTTEAASSSSADAPFEIDPSANCIRVLTESSFARAAYVLRLFPGRALAVASALSTALNNGQFTSIEDNDQRWDLTLLGCGPAPEALGFASFLAERGLGRLSSVVGMDAVQQWEAVFPVLQHRTDSTSTFCNINLSNGNPGDIADQILGAVNPTTASHRTQQVVMFSFVLCELLRGSRQQRSPLFQHCIDFLTELFVKSAEREHSTYFIVTDVSHPVLSAQIGDALNLALIGYRDRRAGASVIMSSSQFEFPVPESVLFEMQMDRINLSVSLMKSRWWFVTLS